MILVATLYDQFKTILQDAAGDRWPVSEFLMWCNEGQGELVRLKPDAKTRTYVAQLVPGAKQTLPNDAISLIEVTRNYLGVSVRRVDRQALDVFKPDWMSTPVASDVSEWMFSPAEPLRYFVSPAQNADPGRVELVYSAKPLVVTIADAVDVIDSYAPRLLSYCLYRAYSKDAEVEQNAALAAAHYQVFSQ